MNFVTAAIQAQEIAALTILVTIYGIPASYYFRQYKDEKRGAALLVVCLVGPVLSVAALLGGPVLRYAALTYFALAMIALVLSVLVEGLRGKRWRWPPSIVWLWGRPRIFLYGLGLVLIAAVCTFVGAALFGNHTTVTTVEAASGEYRVNGTCANGSCYVNECRTPAICGSDNEGELTEETAVDIVCQTRGEVVEAPNGKQSYVWDRLSTHLYVSDLFVSGTRPGKFDPSLARCASS